MDIINKSAEADLECDRQFAKWREYKTMPRVISWSEDSVWPSEGGKLVNFNTTINPDERVQVSYDDPYDLSNIIKDCSVNNLYAMASAIETEIKNRQLKVGAAIDQDMIQKAPDKAIASGGFEGWRCIPYSSGPTWTSESVKKCECGSEKAKTSGHSTWCPKHEG